MHLGYLGIISLMVLSPLPPELFMPLAGFLVAQGKLNFLAAVGAGIIGFLLSIVPWYLAGRFLGEKRLKRLARHAWVPFSSHSLERSINRGNRWFQQHGGKALLLGLFLPGVRNILALPAGVSGMSILTFLGYTTAGSAVWISGLTALGYYLGDRYALVQEHAAPLSNLVWLIVITAGSSWLISRYLQRRRRRLS
jgi:membrane protein DedA with SNARE-associated domain